ADFANELDITVNHSVTTPPKDLHVLVHISRNCGIIQMEFGTIGFRWGRDLEEI
ncbi:hypothetical protein P692DRAFT_20757062, partial [Suillus brevipes Sb2]